MSDLTKRVFKSLCRHFVTLSCIQILNDNGEERPNVFSGFLLGAADQWFFVTAGHVLRELQQAISAGAEFAHWRLDDQTAGNAFNGVAVPFHFDIDEWLIVHSKELGLDYAAVLLHPMYRQALEAGNAIPISKQAWGDYVMEADYWALIGIPAETVSYDRSGPR